MGVTRCKLSSRGGEMKLTISPEEEFQKKRQKQQSSSWQISKNLTSIFLLLVLCLSVVLAGPTAGKQSEPTGSKEASERPSGKDVAAIQAELNSIIQQHDGSSADTGSNQRQLAETIISRLMLDNLTGGLSNYNPEESPVTSGQEDLMDDIMISIPQSNVVIGAGGEPTQASETDSFLVDQAGNQLTGYDAIKSRKFWNLIQQYYENALNNNVNNNRVYGQLPSFGSGSEQATMKRAAARMGNYLHQRTSQGSYPRNNFDFGLGKRLPENSGSSILRYGDLGQATGSGLGQLGKRPSSHRYDFGLGKRVASPTYPRYDFGLGKRAPSRARYDFGLGK